MHVPYRAGRIDPLHRARRIVAVKVRSEGRNPPRPPRHATRHGEEVAVRKGTVRRTDRDRVVTPGLKQDLNGRETELSKMKRGNCT
jgi:hypothetical protein